MRRRSLLVLLCALAIAPNAAAAPPLGATTGVESIQPAYMDVVLPAKARFFSKSEEPNFVVHGGGDVVLLTLRAIDAAEGGRDTVEYSRMRIGDATLFMSSGSFSCPCDEEEPMIKPGRYRLYLQSDAPAKVTLKLPELSGDATLRPSMPVGFEAGPLNELSSDAPFTTVLGRWGQQSSDDGVMHMLATFEGGGPPTLDHGESCLLDAESESQGDGAFGPGCSGPPTPFDVVPLNDGSWGMSMSAFGFPKGRYGLGANLTHAGQAVPGKGLAVWSTYADDAPPVDPAEPAPAPAQPATAPAPPPAAGTLSLTGGRARIRGGRARLRLRCSTAGPCRGSAALAGARSVPVTSLAAGRSLTLKLPLSRAHRRALRRRDRVGARMVLRSQSANGASERRLRVLLLR